MTALELLGTASPHIVGNESVYLVIQLCSLLRSINNFVFILKTIARGQLKLM